MRERATREKAKESAEMRKRVMRESVLCRHFARSDSPAAP